jgi:hypothetical protein
MLNCKIYNQNKSDYFTTTLDKKLALHPVILLVYLLLFGVPTFALTQRDKIFASTE